MPSAKRIRSVVHSIAHHGVSGLCYLHPHLGDACKSAGIDRATIDLLDGGPASQFEQGSKSIANAADALRAKFAEILNSEAMARKDLSEASAMFLFQKGRWPSACYVKVVDKADRAFDVAVDAMGNPAEIVIAPS